MSGIALYWFVLAVVQLTVAAYALAAALTWRGARVWPSRERPLGVVPSVIAGAALVAAVSLMVGVGDVEFTRYLGTGGVMLASLAFVILVLRRADRTG